MIRVEHSRELSHQRLDADVIGDVPLERRGRQAEGAVLRRQPVHRVIGQQNEPGCGLGFDNLIGRIVLHAGPVCCLATSSLIARARVNRKKPATV